MIYKEINNSKNRWIVLIHCVCGTENIFKYQMDMLSKYYNLIIVRLAGHGVASKNVEASIDYTVDEIYKYVQEKNIIVDVMGVSLGAMIASRFYTKYSKCIGKVYLIGAIYGFSYPLFKTGYYMLMKLKRFIPRSLYMFGITGFILPSYVEKEQRKKLFFNAQKMDKYFLFAWMEEMGNFIQYGKKNLSDAIKINGNIEFIYGEKDKIFLNFVKRNISKEYLPNLVLLKGQGHLCNISNFEKFNCLIEGDANEKVANH